MRQTVADRKAAARAQLRLTPPAMLPEKSTWTKFVPWHKTDQSGDILKGYGASAGKVTAPACVLLSPDDFGKMQPGAVLVAVTTTPAWTPLFTLASAVVTDIGGPLSHSSIVAREYGIPAVMAAGLATRRIQDGQIITVDGSAGLITLHGQGKNGGSK
jgi:pyruvate,water dikinase